MKGELEKQIEQLLEANRLEKLEEGLGFLDPEFIELEDILKIINEAKKELWEALDNSRKWGDYKPLIEKLQEWFGDEE